MAILQNFKCYPFKRNLALFCLFEYCKILAQAILTGYASYANVSLRSSYYSSWTSYFCHYYIIFRHFSKGPSNRYFLKRAKTELYYLPRYVGAKIIFIWSLNRPKMPNYWFSGHKPKNCSRTRELPPIDVLSSPKFF